MLYQDYQVCYTRSTKYAIPGHPSMLYQEYQVCYTRTSKYAIPGQPSMLYQDYQVCYTRTSKYAIPGLPSMLYQDNQVCYTRTTKYAIPGVPSMLYQEYQVCYTRRTKYAIPGEPRMFHKENQVCYTSSGDPIIPASREDPIGPSSKPQPAKPGVRFDLPKETRSGRGLKLLPGPNVQRIFFNLPDEKENYEQTKMALDKYFTPHKNVVTERFKFRQRVQKDDESIDNYLISLRELSKSCEFGNLEADMIRDQIIEKCNNKKLKEKLLQQENLTLSKTIDIARMLEISRKEIRLLEPQNDQTLNRVQNKPKKHYNANNFNKGRFTNQETLVQEHEHLFHGLGTIKGYSHKVTLKDNYRPIAQRCRRIPYAMVEAVNQELDKMLENGIIEEVHQGSEWVSNIIVVPKRDSEEIRLCIDLREVDLDPQSRPLTTFITHRGCYRFCKVPFGLSSAPEAYQKGMDSILLDLKGVICYLDDVVVYAKDRQELEERLRKVLQRFDKVGIRLNRNKCKFAMEELDILGHIVSSEGIKPDNRKIEAVLNFPIPKNIEMLRSFLGTCGFLRKFIPNFSKLAEPLNNLTRKNVRWNWDLKTNKAFQDLKESLTKEPCLAYYNLNSPTELITDASPIGLGAVLIQTQQNGIKRPIAYASRSLTDTEKRYSQIEKETLGCVWAIEHFNTYIWGRKFVLKTDHKPLIYMLNPKNGAVLPPRIQRLSWRLQPYDFEIEFIQGKQNIADIFSRQPLSNTSDEEWLEDYVHKVLSITSEELQALSLKEIKVCTEQDPLFQKLKDMVQKGVWPYPLNEEFKCFYKFKDELSIFDNLILKGSRILLPSKLIKRVLRIAYETHQGMTRTKQLLREKYFWINMDFDIENLIRNCPICVRNQPLINDQPLQIVPLPSKPWMKLGIDIVGPIGHHYVLTVIDYYSSYLEAMIIEDISSKTIIEKLMEIFAIHGYPHEVVTDNGLQFVSTSMERFLKECGIRHIKASPYYPKKEDESNIKEFNMVYKEKMKTYNDIIRKASPHNFEIGNLVYVANPNNGKLDSNFRSEHHVILENTSINSFKLVNTKNGKIIHRNAKHLKHVPTQETNQGISDLIPEESQENLSSDSTRIEHLNSSDVQIPDDNSSNQDKDTSLNRPSSSRTGSTFNPVVSDRLDAEALHQLPPEQCPLSWVCKAAVLGPCQFSVVVVVSNEEPHMSSYISITAMSSILGETVRLEIMGEELKEIKEKIEKLYDELFSLDEVDIDKESEAYDSSMNKIGSLRVKIENERKLKDKLADIKPNGSQANIKLPQFDLPIYDGDMGTWINFKELFLTTIDAHPVLTNIQKLQYLNSAVKGEAARLIRGFPLLSENYGQAWSTLLSRYDNPRELAYAQVSKIFSLRAIKNPSAKCLHEFMDVCNEAIRNLETLELKRNQLVDVILVHFLQQKLSENLRKLNVVKSHKLCFNCLRKGHFSWNCMLNQRCKVCKGKHHTMIHYDKPSTEGASAQVENTTPKEHESAINLTNTQQANCNDSHVLLATAGIKIKNGLGKLCTCRALLDSGSQVTMITKGCCERLGLVQRKSDRMIIGVGNTPVQHSSSTVSVTFCPLNNSEEFSVEAVVTGVLTPEIPNFRLKDPNWPTLKNLKLADPEFYIQAPIDMILGADIYTELMLNSPISLGEGLPMAINTRLGWVLLGKLMGTSESNTEVCNLSLQSEPELEFVMKRFWETESVPSPDLCTQDEDRESLFSNNHGRDSHGRYWVKLPFRQHRPLLGESREKALRRFLLLERKLCKNVKLYDQYRGFMKEYEHLNHMERVPIAEVKRELCRCYYMPHHPVIREQSTTTKKRVVFDASAKSENKVSLNQFLHKGPKIQQDVFFILLRFRTYPVAITADIEKMYRQIRIHPEDADYQRILWRPSPEEPVVDYRLLTVTYGTTSAPFLAMRTLQQLAEDEGQNYPEASRVTLNDFYVDDLLTGAQTIAETKELIDQLKDLMKKGGFHLRKWNSNCHEIVSHVEEINEEKKINLEKGAISKILGIVWDHVQDKFRVNITLPEEVVTKRDLLSNIARIFDPIGFLSPTTVALKIIMQELWRGGTGWDEHIPNDIKEKWNNIRAELLKLEDLSIPRYVWACEKDRDVQLHGFCDASSVAYSAVCYLRTVSLDGQVHISMLAAKTRVAPCKSLTLPRLELCAALLLSQLYRSVVDSLKIDIGRTYLWSDSQISLSWIKSDPNRWKTFIHNRVVKIQQLSDRNSWRHVSGKDNPADCASRGIMPAALSGHTLWWQGPTWLKDNNFVQNQDNCYGRECHEEEKVALACQSRVSVCPEIVTKYSTFIKTRRIIAWCLRFITNCQVEACLNSRPLVELSPDPNDLRALTPGHFLIGSPLIEDPGLQNYERVDLRSRWTREYINSLQQRNKWRLSQDNLKPNQLVLIKEDNLPPLQWRLARILEVYPGSDQKVRVAQVRAATGVYLRPITKLAPPHFKSEPGFSGRGDHRLVAGSIPVLSELPFYGLSFDDIVGSSYFSSTSNSLVAGSIPVLSELPFYGLYFDGIEGLSISPQPAIAGSTPVLSELPFYGLYFDGTVGLSISPQPAIAGSIPVLSELPFYGLSFDGIVKSIYVSSTSH
ncbi:hypothetical protein LAZ67_7000738, partial [Cordylochernes scorpioides]